MYSLEGPVHVNKKTDELLGLKLAAMRTLTVFIILLAVCSGSALYSQNSDRTESYLIQDYIINYQWDKESGEWVPATRVQAVYSQNNKLLENITIRLPEGDTVSRIKYFYNDLGRTDYIIAQDYVSGLWVTKYKQVTEYDLYGRRSSVITFLPDGDNWIYSARQHFLLYNEIGKLDSFHSQYWINSDWQSVAIDYYEYDQEGDLIRQYRVLTAGGFSYQAFYTYQDHRMLTRFVQNFNRVTNTWINSYRDTYQYDPCGIRRQYIRERFLSGNWVNEQKTVYFYKLNTPENERNPKVAVCHNGNTIFVSVNAVDAHLAHGDCIGRCADEKDTPPENLNKPESRDIRPPFIVFPNPARESITLKFNPDLEICTRKIELTDSFGRLVRSYLIYDNAEFTITRGNLRSGSYYIRLIGPEIFSTVVVLK